MSSETSSSRSGASTSSSSSSDSASDEEVLVPPRLKKLPLRRTARFATSVSDSESSATFQQLTPGLRPNCRTLSRRQLLDVYGDQVGSRMLDGRHQRKHRRPSYPCLPLAHKGPIIPNRQQVLQQRRKRSSNYAPLPMSHSFCHGENLVRPASVSPCRSPQPFDVRDSAQDSPASSTHSMQQKHALQLRRKNATRRVRKRSSASAAPRITSVAFPGGRKASKADSFLGSGSSSPSSPSRQSYILSPAAAAAVLPSLAVPASSSFLGILPPPVMGTKRKRKALSEGGEICLLTEEGEQRILRGGCDWGPDAAIGDHLWCPTSVSGDFCYVREQDCSRQGPRMKCSACKIIAHAGCIHHLMEMRINCKPTFRDVGVRAYREQTAIAHHWVHRRSQKGKCKHCGKSFQSKLSFSSKEVVAIGCSWCKAAYHNKNSCFGRNRMEEQCNLGLHGSIIVPPSWIVKLPPKGNFKSSLRKPTKKKTSSKKKKEKVSPSASASGIEAGPGQGCDSNATKKEEKEKINKFFAIKPIPSTKLKPVLIFINPKSGGNQGLKLMQKFQWLLNPRQVFDLTQGGPVAGLDLFRKVPNLRILACGGDGTVGWIFSELDKMGIEPPPPVGVLPLGTGNDLARALGWGGGYTDEPISKILCHIEEGDIVQLDRWTLRVEPNSEVSVETQKGGGDATFGEGEVKDSPPLNVVNNYFSIGVDAHIALEFHEAREAHPEKFNSRIRNKMFYGQMGGKDLLQRKWKDLTEYVSLECDGKDFTPKIREHKFHALLFLNIPSYGGGTRPWNNACGKQQTDDGRMEVIGLTTYQLPLLQAGGHGTCICQCQSAKIVTRKTIPMQVDGEACRVKPSIIHLSVLNKAHVVTKRRGRTSHPDGECLQPAEKHTQDDAAVWVPQSNGSGGCVVCRRRGSEQTPSPSAPLGGRTARPPFCKICERSNSDSAVFRSMRDQRRRMQLESDTASELDVCDSDGDVLDHRPHPPPSGTTSTTPTTTTTSSSSSSSVLVAQMTPPAHSTPLPSSPPPPPPPAPASPVSPPQPPAGGGGDERRSQTP